MDREYDIFELVQGAPMWRGHALGLLQARAKLLEISRRTSNELIAMHVLTKEIAARMNVLAGDGKKRS